MNTIEKEVADFLSENSIEFEAKLAERSHFKDSWECDKWYIILTNNKSQRNSEAFDFYTGTGLRKKGKPVTPFAAGVLYGLLSDSCAADEFFEDWCDNLGFNADSIKDKAIYDLCRENARRFFKIVDSTQREKLRELLQDY